MMKGMVGIVRTTALTLFILSFFSATAYILYTAFINNPVFAEVQNTSSNNITLDQVSGYNNFASVNNTQLFNLRAINVSVFIRNSSDICNGHCIQFVTFYYSNGTGSFVAYNLTNNTDRSNSSHQWFYNNTPIIFNSQYNNTAGNGAYRNATFTIFNTTGSVVGPQGYMNNSATHTPVNFTINELSTVAGRNVITVTEPNGTVVNGTNYTTMTPFDVNITANTTFSLGRYLIGNLTQTVASMDATRNSSFSAHNTTPAARFEDSRFNATQNITFLIEDAFGNRSWFNTSATHTPFVFRIDTLLPQAGQLSVEIRNVSEGGYFDATVNSTIINASITLNNGTGSLIPSLGTYPEYIAASITNITNRSYQVIASGNYTLNTNGTHVNVTFRTPDGSVIANGTYNITFVRNPRTYDSGMAVGNYLNVTWHVADNNTMNSTLTVWTSNNQSFTVVGTPISTSSANVTYRANVSSNVSTYSGTRNWQDGRFWVSARGDDYNNSLSQYTTNQTFIKQTLTSARPNLVTWYETATLGRLLQNAPNITRISTYDNRWGFKNFTTCVNGLATNCATNVLESLNVTFVQVSKNITSFRLWVGGGTSYRNTNHTVETGGWNLVGTRTIINNINTTIYNTTGSVTLANTIWSNSTSGQLGTDQLDVTLNITHISMQNNTIGKYCTIKRNFTQTACSPLFNASQLVLPEGGGYWFLANANYSLNITGAGVYRS